MACSRIDAASSESSLSRNVLRGWLGLGAILAIETNSGAAAASGSAGLRSTDGGGAAGVGVGISADRPRPSALRVAMLDPFQNFLGELQIAERALGVDVVEQRRLAVARRLGQAD